MLSLSYILNNGQGVATLEKRAGGGGLSRHHKDQKQRHGTMKFQGLYINIYCQLTNCPQTQWLKTTYIYYLSVCGAEVPERTQKLSWVLSFRVPHKVAIKVPFRAGLKAQRKRSVSKTITWLLADFSSLRVVRFRVLVPSWLLAGGCRQFPDKWPSPAWLLASLKHASQEDNTESSRKTELILHHFCHILLLRRQLLGQPLNRGLRRDRTARRWGSFGSH